MYSRQLTIQKNYSFFLFGPRGSGKSTYLKALFEGQKDLLWIDLLIPEEEAAFQAAPSAELTARFQAKHPRWIVIDEVQKVPKLLELAHKWIEDKKVLFALSGSSARKLKRGQANLLAGRAFVFHLFPLTYQEVCNQGAFSLEYALHWGLLPKLFSFETDEERRLFLTAYAHTYLREEIQIEQIVRNLPAFRKFLEIAAQMNGEPINYSSIGKDMGSDHISCKKFYDILEDTLLGFRLAPYDQSIRKQQRKASKFYFIDCGIKRALERSLTIPLLPKSFEYGKMFEHFLISEIYKLCHYRNRDERIFYLRTKDDLEVDLIIERPGKKSIFIEIKSTEFVRKEHTHAVASLSLGLEVEAILLSQDPNEKQFDHVHCMPWQKFFQFWAES